jgi:hypothetical protein
MGRTVTLVGMIQFHGCACSVNRALPNKKDRTGGVRQRKARSLPNREDSGPFDIPPQTRTGAGSHCHHVNSRVPERGAADSPVNQAGATRRFRRSRRVWRARPGGWHAQCRGDQ